MSKTYHWSLRVSPTEIKLFRTNDEARAWHAANLRNEGSFRELFPWDGPEESDNKFMADHAMEWRENILLEKSVDLEKREAEMPEETASNK